MKIFETPIMNIAMFKAENVATTASADTVDTAKNNLATNMGVTEVTEANTFTFTF